jgi:hypothetical protein
MGPVSRVTFIYVVHVGHNTLADHGWRPDPQGARGPTSTFAALMVGALGYLSAPAIDVFYVDGGRSRISVNTSQGAHR